jgi:hypothetical protein
MLRPSSIRLWSAPRKVAAAGLDGVSKVYVGTSSAVLEWTPDGLGFFHP